MAQVAIIVKNEVRLREECQVFQEKCFKQIKRKNPPKVEGNQRNLVHLVL